MRSERVAQPHIAGIAFRTRPKAVCIFYLGINAETGVQLAAENSASLFRLESAVTSQLLALLRSSGLTFCVAPWRVESSVTVQGEDPITYNGRENKRPRIKGRTIIAMMLHFVNIHDNYI